jgi:hypothetical protein
MSLLSLMIGNNALLSRAAFAHNAAYHDSIQSIPFKLTFGYHPWTPVAEVVEVVHSASAAFVERLQSALSFGGTQIGLPLNTD